MEYGLAAWGLRFTPLREQLAMVRRLKLKFLELGIAGFPTDLLQPDSAECFVDTVKALFRANSLVPFCAATGNDFTQASESATLASLEATLRVLKLADALGVRRLRIFAGFIPAAEVKGRRYVLLAEALRRVYEAAAKTRVIPVVETHGTADHTASVTTEDALLERLFDDVPAMRLNFDPANLHVLGRDVCAFYRRWREKIDYIHLKDFRRAGNKWIAAACGEGTMEWDALLEELRSFDGPVLLEYEIPDDVERGFAASLEFLRRKERPGAR